MKIIPGPERHNGGGSYVIAIGFGELADGVPADTDKISVIVAAGNGVLIFNASIVFDAFVGGHVVNDMPGTPATVVADIGLRELGPDETHGEAVLRAVRAVARHHDAIEAVTLEGSPA